MTDCFRGSIERATQDFLDRRKAKDGRSDVEIDKVGDLIASNLLDSLALTELVLHVEQTCDTEIDFLLIDPDSIGSLKSLVDAFAIAAVREA